MIQKSQWTEDDKTNFVKYLKKYGRDYDKIAKKVGNKTSA